MRQRVQNTLSGTQRKNLAHSTHNPISIKIYLFPLKIAFNKIQYGACS